MAKVMGWTSASWFFVFTPLWLIITLFGIAYCVGKSETKKEK